jgi:hypothetical protein
LALQANLQGLQAFSAAKGEQLALSPRRVLGYTNPLSGREPPAFSSISMSDHERDDQD